MEEGGLAGQRENSKHRKLRDIEDRVQRPNLNLNSYIKKKTRKSNNQRYNE